MDAFTLHVSTTRKRQIVDLTDLMNARLQGLDAIEGLCFFFVKHTTAALAVQETGEGTEEDLLEVLDALVPKIRFRHGHDPAHAPDHMLSSIVGPGLTVPVAKGRLELGAWQRVLLVELNGPRDREIAVRVLD